MSASSSNTNNSPSFRQQAPAALSTSLIDSDYDYSAATGSNNNTGTSGGGGNSSNSNSNSASAVPASSSGGAMKSPTTVTAASSSSSSNAYSNIRTTPTSAAAHYTAAALRAAKEKAAQNLHKLHIDNLDQYNDGDEYDDEEGEEEDLAGADGEEALLDLVQLEELHQEAERMKALGNKHMAAQEFTRAYNAYSAALQLSPVGPSSHVFLSNRAAALLSLKRYTAAATDARRAIALAPTFGKAHARLGQALYFQKQYAGAVAAYEDAIRFEPDNDVTVTYLEKAKAKQEKHAAKQTSRNKQQAQNQQAQHNTSTSSSKGSGSGNNNNSSNNDVDSGELREHGDGDAGEADTATQFTTSANQSVTTTDHQQTSIITGRGGGWRGRNNPAILKAAQARDSISNNKDMLPNNSNHSNQSSLSGDNKQEGGPDQAGQNNDNNNNNNQETEQPQQPITADPDFHEALRIQQRANRYLAKKEYKAAIEEYTAALFLVPDDAQLSPDLHLGRAHALNGSRRHESARNDCILAIRLASPDNAAPAYSTLAKSLFYMKEYHGSVEAFYQCMELLQAQGETLGMFDKAYLQKAEAALEEDAASLNISGKDGAHHRGGGASVSSKTSSVVPKLPPPRFVPREEAIQKAPSIPSMPKQWQQAQKQLPTSPCALKCGPERSIIFYSEALGIKLNRGPDGMVRVLSVAPNTPASPVAKSGGDILVGDIVREAAGVDIRRPITNVMWGDTVALIKMAPRPITLIVAMELSEVPPAVLEEQKRALTQPLSPSRSFKPPVAMTEHDLGPNNRSSFASGDEPVAERITARAAATAATHTAADAATTAQEESTLEVSLPSVDHAASSADALAATAPPPPASAAISADNVVTACSSPLPPCSVAAAGDDDKEKKQEAVVVVDDPPLLLPTAESQDELEEDEEEDSRNQQTASAIATTTNDANSAVLESKDENSGDTQAKDDWVAVDDPDVTQTEVGAGAAAADNAKAQQPTVLDTKASSSDCVVVGETTVMSASALSTDLRSTMGLFTDESRTGLREEEDRLLAGEVLFAAGSPPAYNGWDSLRWMSYSGSRKITFCKPVYRLVDVGQKVLFWNVGQKFVERQLAIYEEPRLILVLRRPNGVEEMRSLLYLPSGAELAECEQNVQNYWVVESVLDTAFSKLRLSALTTSTSRVIVQDSPPDARAETCLELISPAESIFLSAVRVRNEARKKERSFTDSGAFLETSTVEIEITKVLCSAHKREDIGVWEADIAWKHQLILGTLHSYVLSRNLEALEQAMERARKSMPVEEKTPGNPHLLPDRIINAVDDQGRTPLYYACMSRMNVAVAALLSSGATADFRIEPNAWTLAHVCARNLDDKSLSVVLAATPTNRRSSRPDPNALDALGMTPMHIACVDGKTVRGGSDSAALERCLTALEAWGGQMMVDLPRPTRHPLNVLACEFRKDDLAVALNHVESRYPIKSSTLFRQPGSISVSVSALFQYPLHSIMIVFLERVQSLSAKKEAPPTTLVQTIQLLLEHGFEPNERVEQMEFPDGVNVGNYIGFSPLQILACAGLELDKIPAELKELHGRWMTVIAQTSELLVKNGARVSLDAPPEQRQKRSSSSVENEASSVASQATPRSMLKIDNNSQLMDRLGGKELLNAARKAWCAEKPIAASSRLFLLERDDTTSIEDSDEAGGSSDKSCAICWKPFGTLVNRKHKCRVSWRYLCDECSMKRVIVHGGSNKEVRLSDGQFLLARADAIKAQMEFSSAAPTPQPVRGAGQKDLATLRLERLEAEGQADRDSLFGGVLEQAANFVFGAEATEGTGGAATGPDTTSSQVNGLAASLGEVRNALLERGDKLSSLSDKSAQMVNASEDFAKMAKELRKQSECGLFW